MRFCRRTYAAAVAGMARKRQMRGITAPDRIPNRLRNKGKRDVIWKAEIGKAES